MMLDARRYRSIRRASEAVKVALASALALAVAGCSFSSSIMGVADDEPEVTGSIVSKPATPLSPALNDEDWRRAKAALSVALDPQGPGTLVSWDNPQTTLKGEFIPAGAPYVRNDEICRDFTSVIAGSAPSRQQGSACRPSGGDWEIKEVRTVKAGEPPASASATQKPAEIKAVAKERPASKPAPPTKS